MIHRTVNAAELFSANGFAKLEHDDAIAQIRAWSREGQTEAQIVVATRMGVESIRRAIGGIEAVPRM